MEKDRIVWFCESCDASNVFRIDKFEKDDLDCDSCSDSFKATALVFNIDKFTNTIPLEGRLTLGSSDPTSPYFKDGGVSIRPMRQFSAVWD